MATFIIFNHNDDDGSSVVGLDIEFSEVSLGNYYRTFFDVSMMDFGGLVSRIIHRIFIVENCGDEADTLKY